GSASYQIRAMAVSPHCRGQGLGKLLLVGVEHFLASRGTALVWANARSEAVGFYQQQGYRVVSDEFVIADVGPHYLVSKSLVCKSLVSKSLNNVGVMPCPRRYSLFINKTKRFTDDPRHCPCPWHLPGCHCAVCHRKTAHRCGSIARSLQSGNLGAGQPGGGPERLQ